MNLLLLQTEQQMHDEDATLSGTKGKTVSCQARAISDVPVDDRWPTSILYLFFSMTSPSQTHSGSTWAVLPVLF
jgi:hypothetical protein